MSTTWDGTIRAALPRGPRPSAKHRDGLDPILLHVVALRLEKQVTVRELARLAGYKEQTVRAWLDGRSRPAKEHAKHLLDTVTSVP